MTELHGRRVLVAGLCWVAMGTVAVPVAGAQSAPRTGYDESQVLGKLENLENRDAAPARQQDALAGRRTGDDAPVAVAARSQSEDKGGELPFTGLDVGVLAALGAILVLTGIAVRRAGRDPA
ncbi:MAG: hypothetical protein M3N16_07585 [Actinomycetota bacterium]|nr:hypothetical protein [Actinomycetota bacterium]